MGNARKSQVHSVSAVSASLCLSPLVPSACMGKGICKFRHEAQQAGKPLYQLHERREREKTSKTVNAGSLTALPYRGAFCLFP